MGYRHLTFRSSVYMKNLFEAISLNLQLEPTSSPNVVWYKKSVAKLTLKQEPQTRARNISSFADTCPFRQKPTRDEDVCTTKIDLCSRGTLVLDDTGSECRQTTLSD